MISSLSNARPEDVEDVAQEVFLRLYFSLDQLRTAEVFEPWLYRLTVNAAYDYLRKQRRRPEYRMSDLSEQQVLMADATAGGKVEHDDQYQKKIRESVDALLGAVSEADRILLMLKEVEGLSLKELSSQRKCSKGPPVSGSAARPKGLRSVNERQGAGASRLKV